jgi:hypothetical protein
MIAHPHDEIEAFALGGLDEVAARRVLTHADQCPSCAVLLAEAMSVAHALEPSGERALTKQIQLGDRAAARGILASSSGGQRRWMLQIAALAATVLILVWSVDLIRNMRSTTFTVPVASLVHSHFTHHALHGASGSAKVIQSLDGRWLYLLADGLAPKARYELVETINGTDRELGQFATTDSGQATAYWEQAPARIEAFRVTPVAASAPSLRWP